MSEESKESKEELPQNLREIAISMMNYGVTVKSTFEKDTLATLAKMSLSLMKKIREEEKKP